MLWHGSRYKFEGPVRASPSALLDGEAVIFATPLRWLAALFALPWSDADLQLGVNEDGSWLLEEQRPGVLAHLCKQYPEIYLYPLAPATFTSADPRLGLRDIEFISHQPALETCGEPVQVVSLLLDPHQCPPLADRLQRLNLSIGNW